MPVQVLTLPSALWRKCDAMKQNRKYFSDMRKLKWPGSLKKLKHLGPLVLPWHYEIDYIHSYGQDSPFFLGLARKKLLGTECKACDYKFATPKLSCMQCGGDCDWIELPKTGKIHSWTKCYYGSEAFLKETPFFLALVEFEGIHTLFLTRLKGIKDEKDLRINMPVKACFAKKVKYSATDIWFERVEKGR